MLCYQNNWLGLTVIGTALSFFPVCPSVAQIAPDGTLGTEASLVRADRLIRGLPTTLIEGGAIRGSNLFQSFLEFNVGDGQRVYFANPASIKNIFGRVTGDTRSNILGTLGVDGSANLFLLNPNGILFGPNARLDVAGSFTASTANRVVFDNGLTFSATNPETPPPLLTIKVRPGLQYDPNPQGTISNAGTLRAGQDLTLAAGNLDLQGELQAGGDLTLRSLDTLRVRDSVTQPFIARAGGQLLVQGDRAIDIFALNHPNSGFFSGGDLVLRSANSITGDAHYYATGNFHIEKLDRTPGTLFSPFDPIILAIGDVVVGDYVGESLHILAGGSVTLGNVTITGPGNVQTTINPNNPNPIFAALSITPYGTIDGSAGSTLDVRAGIDWASALPGSVFIPSPGGVFNPDPPFISPFPPLSDSRIRVTSINNGSSAGLNGPTFLTNNYIPNLGLPVGSIEISNSIGAFSNVVIDSRGSIRTGSPSTPGLGGIDTSVPQSNPGVNGLRGVAGSIVLLANGSIDTTRGKLNSIVGTIEQTTGSVALEDGTAGNIFLTSQNGRIDTADITSSVRGGNGGMISLDAGSDIRTFGLITSFAQATPMQGVPGNGGNVTLRSRRGNIDTRGGYVNSATSFGSSGEITFTASGNIVTGSDSNDTPAVGSYVGGSGSGRAGNISLTSLAGTIDTRAGMLNSATGSEKAGDITLNAAGDIFTANINSFTNGTGDAGAVSIDSGGRFSLSNSTILSRTSGTGRGGDITIKAAGAVSLTNLAFLRSSTEGTQAGDSGNVRIEAQSLFMNGGSEVIALTLGSGDAGNITVIVPGAITLSGVAPFPVLPDGNPGGFSTGLFASTEQAATGQGGIIDITAGSLLIEQGAAISARSRGAGNVVDPAMPDANAIIVKVNTLDLTSGGQILTTAFSTGRAGGIEVAATGDIKIMGSDPTYRTRFDSVVARFNQEIASATLDVTGPQSGLQAQSTSNDGTGSGKITVSSSGGSIIVTDNAEIDSSIVGRDRAAGLILLSANSGAVTIDNARIFSIVATGAVNSSAGGIAILGDTISLRNRAELQTQINPNASGRAGSILLRANKNVEVSNSAIFSSIEPNAISTRVNDSQNDFFQLDRGAVAIGAENILFSDGAKIDVSTKGQGNAGFAVLVANNSISFNNSFIFSTVELTSSAGDAGGIAIQTRLLSLDNGSELQTLSRNRGNAGNIFIQATDAVNLIGSSPAGFPSGLFANTESNTTATGGSIEVSTRRLNLQAGGQIAVNTQSINPAAVAGNITLTTDSVTLSGQGLITATTQSGRGGNIKISASRFLLLSGSSQIATDAGTDMNPGQDNAGNITITTPFIFAFPSRNNDITAEAYNGTGGRITISAQRLFDIKQRTLSPTTNDISARSQIAPGVDGVVEITQLNIDPVQGISGLPVGVVDPSNLIAQGCNSTGGSEVGQFALTGRGGLPPSPNESLGGEAVWEDARLPTSVVGEAGSAREQRGSQNPESKAQNSAAPIVPAVGWVFNGNGEVTLVAAAQAADPLRSLPSNCRVR